VCWRSARTAIGVWGFHSTYVSTYPHTTRVVASFNRLLTFCADNFQLPMTSPVATSFNRLLMFRADISTYL
jgi:hypothetical protein